MGSGRVDDKHKGKRVSQTGPSILKGLIRSRSISGEEREY